MRSGWLLRDGDVVCAIEITESFGERVRGLRGRARCEGGLYLDGARAVHTVDDLPVNRHAAMQIQFELHVY